MYKIRGLIIKKTSLGEYDRLLTVYSRERGKILLKARSVRKNQAKLRGHLELFLLSHLMAAPGRGFDIVAGADTIEGFAFLRRRLSSLAAAYYLSEVLDKLIAGPEKDEGVWNLVLESFSALNERGCDINFVISNFEKRILKFLGYGFGQKAFNSFVPGLINNKLASTHFLKKVLEWEQTDKN